MIKISILFISGTLLLLGSSAPSQESVEGALVEVSSSSKDYGEEWEVKEFKHSMFDEYMPKKEDEIQVVQEVVQEVIVEDEIYEEEYIAYEEEYIEEEVYVEQAVYEEVVETVEEVYEEPVYTNGISFEATAYAVGGWAVPGTVTADGTDISGTIYSSSGYRIIAVDPSVIPMGTVVKVTYSDGTTFLAQASDTGGFIVGNRIDILYDNVPDALAFGRQNITVEFIN